METGLKAIRERLCVILFVCLSLYKIKTKTAETKITKRATVIVLHKSSPTNY